MKLSQASKTRKRTRTSPWRLQLRHFSHKLRMMLVKNGNGRLHKNLKVAVPQEKNYNLNKSRDGRLKPSASCKLSLAGRARLLRRPTQDTAPAPDRRPTQLQRAVPRHPCQSRHRSG